MNVLVYAFRRDSTRHQEYRAWLQALVDGPNAYGVSPQVLASVRRICTHPKISTDGDYVRFRALRWQRPFD